MNTRKVKDKNDEEPAVTNIEVIKESGYLKTMSLVKISLTTWMQRMNARAWQLQIKSIGLNSTTL